MNKCFIILFVYGICSCMEMYADSFLTTSDMPAGENYLPPPPAYNSERFFNDWVAYKWGKSMRPTDRGKQVVSDASTSINYFCSTFSPAFGMTISSSNTPELYALLSKARVDGNNAAKSVKNFYMKTRPFMKFEEPTSVPSSEASLRTNGSYPSGHTAQGWTLTLILAEINPARQDTILSRGYQYGQSRAIGGFHWLSDVDAGRCIASAAVARLHADPAFMEQLRKAKEEFARKASSKAMLKKEEFDYHLLPEAQADDNK